MGNEKKPYHPTGQLHLTGGLAGQADALSLCWLNAGLASATLAQHRTNTCPHRYPFDYRRRSLWTTDAAYIPTVDFPLNLLEKIILLAIPRKI